MWLQSKIGVCFLRFRYCVPVAGFAKRRKVGLGRLKPCCDEIGKLQNYHSESDDSIVMMGPDELYCANNRGSC